MKQIMTVQKDGTIKTATVMYSIQSESEDGIYYLVNGWKKHDAFWKPLDKLRQDMCFKTLADAKRSLAKLLKAMPDYALDRLDGYEIICSEDGTVKVGSWTGWL